MGSLGTLSAKRLGALTLPATESPAAAPGPADQTGEPLGGAIVLAGDPGMSRRAAEAALRRSLTRPTDGFLATWIDRRISTRLSCRLARTRVTPNQLTLLTLVPALGGAALLAIPDRLWSTAGAVLFWFSTVLDGCDGEVARLKHQESARGARLDLLCDNLALVAVFVAIVAHTYLENPRSTVLFPAAAVLVGLLGCIISEYRLILRPRIVSGSLPAALPPGINARRVQWYERLASRDFAYLLPFLALGGLLRYLVWATAIGVNVFWLILVFFVAPRSRRS